MLHANFPQSLGRSVVEQLEGDRRFKLLKLDTRKTSGRCLAAAARRGSNLHLCGADLDVEIVPFVGDLQDLWPGKAVDPQSVSVDQQAATAHAQHDGHALRVLRTRKAVVEGSRWKYIIYYNIPHAEIILCACVRACVYPGMMKVNSIH